MFFFFKQKTAYEMRISDWSSDVCSSDLFQGDDLTSDTSVMACAKPFAAYGAAESGLDYNPVDISERTLEQVYFPPFKAALEAGCGTVMASFNEINGVPAHANHWLLTDVLRKAWNFGGVVVSDYTGDMELIDAGYAADARDATMKAFLAGVDMSIDRKSTRLNSSH